MTAGFWLKVNGKWVPLEGVQAGVPINSERPMSELVVNGGRRYVSRAKWGPREWSLDFTHATPHAVRLMMLAANGQAGEVELLDVSRARSNMLDPSSCVGGDSAYPVIDVEGVPLRSVTTSGIGTSVEHVVASANAMVRSTAPNTSLGGSLLRLTTGGGSERIPLRFSPPATPDGKTFASATLLLSEQPNSTPSGSSTIAIRVGLNNWTEDSVTWLTTPMTEATDRASGSKSSGAWAITLPNMSGYMGTDVTLEARLLSTGVQTIANRINTNPLLRPRLRIAYTSPGDDHVFSRPLRGGCSYNLSAYTDAASGTSVLWYNIGAGGVAISAPAGTGPRRAAVTFTPPTDVLLSGVVPAATAGLVSGLQLTEGASPGPWVPGQKTPCRVSISDPEQTLNFLYDGEQGRSDYRVTLKEVG